MTNQSPQNYELLHREILYQGIFTLARYHLRHEVFSGGWSDVVEREVLERLSAAAVLPYDPVLDRVILIEQFRPGALNRGDSPWLIEIVAGVYRTEKPADVAIREADEEAGCLISDLILIHDYHVSPGGTDEYLHVYCGKTDATNVQGIHGLAHEHEDIRVLNVTSEEAFALLDNGKIKTAPAIVALQWLRMNKEMLQKKWKAD
ncbi:ADP-ribose pyrophosphatase [Gammaproteobacteria bacterium SCGC AG-212-F23]|nr:ADP-ribose pyrophosphatase [Gammaproteobacteria bacterium SCGC AG-212-F23]